MSSATTKGEMVTSSSGTLLIEIQGEARVDTNADTLHHIILWLSRCKLLLAAAESSGHHNSLSEKTSKTENVSVSLDSMMHAWLRRFHGEKMKNGSASMRKQYKLEFVCRLWIVACVSWSRIFDS